MKEKVYIKIIFIILIILLGFFIIQYINDNNEQSKRIGTFYRGLHAQISNTIFPLKSMQECYSNKNYDNLSIYENSLITELSTLNQKLTDGYELVDNRMFIPDFVIRNIISAIKGESNQKQSSISSDGVISEKEIKFINQLYNDLEVLKESMENDNKGVSLVNAKMDILEFTKNLNMFEKRWTKNNTESGYDNSPFNYLIP